MNFSSKVSEQSLFTTRLPSGMGTGKHPHSPGFGFTRRKMFWDDPGRTQRGRRAGTRGPGAAPRCARGRCGELGRVGTNCRCPSLLTGRGSSHVCSSFLTFLHFQNTLHISSCFRNHFHKMIEKSPRPLTRRSIGSGYPDFLSSAATTDLVYPSSSPTLFRDPQALLASVPCLPFSRLAPYLGSTGKRGVPTVEGCPCLLPEKP